MGTVLTSWQNRSSGSRRDAIAGAGVTLLVTACCLALSPLSDRLTGWSYDLLFLLRPRLDLEGAVIVAMDRDSYIRLKQDASGKWDRALHAQLLQRLREAGAKAVVFDIVFAQPWENPEVDRLFAEAIAAHGRVVLAAQLDYTTDSREVVMTRSWLPLPALGTNVPWGVDAFPNEFDETPRRHYQSPVYTNLAARTLELLGRPPGPPAGERWINYYGPPGTIRTVSYDQVLSNALAPDFFSNQVVFVGRGAIPTPAGSPNDKLRTPYTWWTWSRSPGVEVHATCFLNLWRRDWLRRLPRWFEMLLIAATGLLAGYGLPGLRPAAAAGVALVSALAAAAITAYAFVQHYHWFPWLIASAVQIPCALAWALLTRTRSVSGEKEALASSSSSAPAKSPTALARAATALDTSQMPTSPGAHPALAGPGGTRKIAVVSDHTLLRCVGRGAYGEVWLARDVIGTFHAVKIVYRNSFDNEEPYEREFHGLQKYTPISRTHPGWVHMLHIGRNDPEGYFFCIMEVGDDELSGPEIDPNSYQPRNLARELKKHGRFPIDECVRLGVALAEALEHLHRHRLIHRDIKPSNVIFVKGVPKFADIGLVTELKGADGEASYLGTEGYIAPEGPGTASADVYSLGKLLYEISMGRDRREFPELPTVVLGGLETPHLRRLQKIVLRACAAEPLRRYQSAAELSADLQELQRGLEGAGPAGP